MSWIALEDVVGGLRFVLDNEALRGPVNFVAPNPVTNAEFTKALGSALSRPTIFSVPAFGARLAFGEMADALLLASQRVKPEKLQKAGYEFKLANIDGALTTALAK
jgi:NAD dependent epimerase/dehydratase family enzyme